MKKITLFALTLWFVVFLTPLVIIKTPPEDDQDAVSAAVIFDKPDEQDKPDEAAGGDTGESINNTSGADSIDGGVEITVNIGGEVRAMRLDDYLAGVLAAEMPASFPDDALRAQAVAARSYVMQKKRAFDSGGSVHDSHGGAMMCDRAAHCSAYVDLEREATRLFGSNAELYTERLRAAVRDTDAMIAVYNDEPILAAFHAISGGQTERASDVWGTDVPYLQSVASPGEEAAAKYNGEVKITADAFREKFLAFSPDAVLGDSPDRWFHDSVRSEAGGILTVWVGDTQVTGRDIRAMLALQSTDFTLSVGEEDGEVCMTFKTTGYGHGVGLSQYGARQMALDGYDWRDIIAHYYTGVDIVPISDMP